MEPTIYKPSIYKGAGIYNTVDNGVNYINNYDPDTIYFAGASVKHNGKVYLFNHNDKVTGSFDENKWKEVNLDELNKFFDIDFTSNANDYDYCNFAYNPFLKIVLGHINIKFINQIQTTYNFNNLSIRFSMPFIGYGATSSFAIDSSNKIIYSQDSQVCCQLLDLDCDDIHSGVSFWTNGLSNVYGMMTSQVVARMVTEKKNNS